MPINSKVKKLYDTLKAGGGDVGTPEEFNSWFFKAGKEGYRNRKSVYDTFKADGADVGKSYEEFGKWLGLHAVGTPTVNKYRKQLFDSVDPNKSRASEFTRRAVGLAVRATNNVRKPVTAKYVNKDGKPTGKEFAITPAKTVEDLDREYAQEVTKNWENELHDQMADADKDAAKISDMFKSFIGSTDEVGSVWGNMTRGGGISGTPHSVTTNNGILENTESRQLLAASDYNRKRKELLQLEQDSRLSKDTSLLGGVREAYNDIKNGEFSKAGKDLVYGAGFDDHSFFRGMYDAAKDTGLLTGGASDLINAGSLLSTKQDLDNGVHTEAGDMLMQQAVKNSNAQGQYGDNRGWMYTGGVITTNMAPFVVQIASAGFSKGMSTSIGKVVQGVASKAALGTMKKAAGFASADLAKNIGKFTGLTTKAFGKAIQYGIVGAAQANTVGLGNVANDVMNRYTGQVYQDEKGNYKFGTFDSDGNLVHEGGEDFLTALAKGDAAQTIEFATELAGGGIDAVGTALKNFVTKGGKKIIEKYSMENVSKVIDFLLNNKVSKNVRYLKAGADRTLGKVELNSIVGESLEEELGIIANTVFTGDNKISDLWDSKQQSQIWGGMLLSIGLMKGAVAPFHAYNAKQYYSYKHKLNKADANLSQLLGNEKWEELRDQIDATTNKDMPDMINKINRDVALGKNRQPVREYIQNLIIMRGYDIGNMLAAKKAVEDKGEGVSVKNMEKNQAYQQGRDAYGYDTHEIQLDQEDKQKSLAQLLGISEQQLSGMSDEELESMTGQDDKLDRAIYDYQLSSARYEGVVDNARDQIDLEVQRAAQAVDMYTDKSRNTIRNATIKATGGLEDYGVYIINGNIATHDDGSIDISNSDDMILYYDTTTNTVEHSDATMFAELGSEENADEVRSQAMADAKEKAIKETTGIIDGVVEVGTQFKATDADGTEHTYEVLADNGDGTAIITIDGNIPTELVKGENVQVPVSFEELQKMKDDSDQQRLQAAKDQREQMEKERAEQQTQAQTTQAENPAQESNTQSAPIEDNLDYSDIIREDGKVQMVDVSDKDGNNLFPDANDVFYIQGNKMRTKFAYIDANGELKTQSFPTGLIKIKTRGEVSVDDYKKYRNTILAAESSSMPETSMIEDNSGTIEADRGGIEVDDNTQPLSEADADNVIAQMESSAEVVPELELTPDNWAAEFGEDGIVSTPIGDVKMGENQVAKLFEKGRSKEFGMIKPTLTNPDVIIEVPSHSADGNEERSSSYLFIKTFLGKNGKKVYYFKSVTIKKDGLEISISSHYDRAKRVKEALMKGKLLYRKNDGAQTEQNQPSASVTTSQEDAAGSSENKDTTISSNGNENNESLTFEDGTPIPVDENGEVDLSQTDAAHAAEWYDTNLGEDADDWLDGEIKKAKKVLEQAQNKKVTGTKPSELVASKKEKEADIAEAQARYDSAISIREDLKERRITKEESTPEGRKNLIDKARRKFARLKSSVNDDAEAVSQLYRDTVGSLLHRLYDSTGVDVFDDTTNTVDEYVAANVVPYSLNYEGNENSKGVQQETGLSRSDFAKLGWLAKDGKGTTIDAMVHHLWDNRPSNLENADTQEIRNALLSLITSGQTAYESRNYIQNKRIEQAEKALEEQELAAENAEYAEQQKAKEEEKKKAEEENEKINEQTNENINAPEDAEGTQKINFPDKLKEGSETIEVPEDATDENPLGLQLGEDKVPFEIKGEKSGDTYDINDKEDRQRLVAENSVDDKDILDIDMPEHVHKAIKELCKKMGLKVQFLYMGARSNGWIENGTMYLALDTEKATQFVFGHEMTHAIKQKNPEAYNELVKVAMAVTTKKKFEEDLSKVYQNYHGISGYNNVDDYVEEVVADNLGKFINNFDLARKFSLRLNHPVLATILHAIQKIKGLLYGDFYKSVDALERIVEKAYVDTANGQVTNSETGEDVSFSLRQKPEPKKKGIGYKVFVLKDGKLYPPMVANPDGAATPVGVWLDADAAPIAGESKTGRPQVKQGGKGTQGGSGKLAYRPGWHLGVVPYAIQFNRKDAEGNKTLFPKNFVFAEVEYAADVDYQEEARQEGINPSGKYQHSLAGLKHLPTDGYYMYRTNPNPETDPWVITGAMKVNRILTRAEQAELVKKAGREPQQIQEGDIVTDDVVNSINQEIADAPKFSLKVYHGSGADFTEFDFDHMGEGAGSQVFGWGGYVTSSKKIGKSYATLMDNDPSKAYYRIQRSNGTRFAKKYPTLESFLHGDKKIAMNDKFTEQEKIDFYNEMKKLAEPYHNLYEVDIPEDNDSNYLDWDKPLSKKQQDAIREGLEHLGVGIKTLESKGQSLERTGENVYNSTLYIGLTGTEYDLPEKTKGISKFLSSVGFTGIKYKAGRNFGGAKKGDVNYVIFKPEDMKITEHTKFSLRLKSAIEETETNPSDAQKESGNYKKGHIKFGGYDYTIENPKGSTRSGKDANGKEWKVTMHDTYGYIRGKFGKDGDHLDMFINDKADLDNWNGDVFVVDQVNPDGSFDEHKVMYGYDSMSDAEKAYLANYSKGWQGLGNITGASKEEFDKWLDTSNRKLKPFADYAKVKFSQAQSVAGEKRESLENDKSMDTATSSLGGDTALSQSKGSAAKIDNFSETSKENGEKFSLKDDEYLKAVEDGNMEKAQKMVNEAADAAGYSTDSSYQGTSAFNGAAPWGNGYYLTKDERKEAWDNGEFEGESTLGDYINDDIDGGNLEELTNAASYRAADPMRKEAIGNVRNAIQKKAKTITMYRSVPSDVKEGSFRNGDWVTPSRAYAVDNAKLHGWGDDYNIIEQKVPVDDVWFDGNDIAEWGYGREEDYVNDTDFAYKNTKNNRKLLDAVTYDDNGNVIPLSQRFNENNADVRYSLKDEKTMFGMHNISLDKLRKAIKQGGFAAPSMGVIDSKNGIYSGYGEITLIPKAEKIAKRTGKNIGTYAADAWTPIYPPVEKKFGGNGGDVAYNDIESVPTEMQGITRNAIDGFMDGRDANSLAYLYLHEKGKAPELVHVEGKYPKELHDEVKGILGKSNGIYNTTDEQKEKLLDLFIREVYDGNREEFDNDIKKIIKKDEEFIKKRPNSNIAKNKQLDVDWMKEHGYDYGALSRFVDGILRDAETSGKVDENATMKAAQQYIQDKGMKEDFDSWKEKLNDRYQVEEVIFAGYKPDGNRKYLPNTVENAVKVMKQDGKNASVGTASFSHFVASILKPMGTLDQIRKKKGNLTGNYEDVEKFQEKWQPVYDELADKMQPDAGPFESYGMDRLEEAATQKNPKKYAKEEYGVDLTDEDINKLNELIEAVKNDKPSIYFETKFMRPYGLDEFEKAIVPNDTPSDVVDALKKAGIDVSRYERGNAEDRQKVTMDAINSSDNIRFSIRQFGTDIADASDKIKNLMNNEKIISRRIGSRAQAQSRVLETISRASDEFRRSNRASAKSGQDTWEKDRALGYVIRASYGTGSFLTEEEIKEITSGKVGNGQENQVYLSKDGKTVIKLNNLLMVDREFRFNEFLDRIKAHNEFTPDDMYTPLGFALNEDGDFCLVLEQPYVKGEPATQEEIDDYMESHGYELYPVRVSADEVGAGWSNGEFEIWDTKPRNVLKDKNGDLHFIDTVIQHAFIDGHNDKLRLSLRGSTPYDKQMEEWMEKNHLEKGAVPMEKPVMKEGENIFDYANRMVEWTRNQNLWKTAPKQTGFQDALDKWKADNGLSPDAYPPFRPHRENYSTEIGYTEDLEEYNKKKELWKSAPKPKDFDLSVDLEDMNKQLRNIRRAVLNQKNYDQRTVKAVSDLVRKMLNIGWGDGLSRGKVGNLLSAAKNAAGANDVKKYLDKAMGILAENYLNRLSTAYDNLINTKGARADQSGVIKMGSLDAKGQAFMSEYKKAINMDDKSLNNYIANIEEDSAKNEDNVEMNDYRLAGIQAAIMFKQQIGGNDADIAELQRQIAELKNKKDVTKEDKDLLKSLEKKLFENKFDRITMYENLLNNIQRMVKESKGRAKEFREEITEHKNEILHRANLDLEGVDSTYYDTTTAKKKLVNNDLQRAVFSSTYTFEQFLKFFGKKAANGEGYLYNYFTKLNQDALDEEQLYNEMNRNALDEKTKELFGKEKFMKLVGIDGKGMKEMDVEVTDYSNKETGKRTIHLKQGQMLYIYLVNKETDGEMKLRAMGITEEDVAAIEANLDPRVKAMGEWLQDEYLPECQRRYQATHTKYFGAPMKEVDNYFPLAINNRARNVKEDVNQDSDAMSQLAGTSTGAIVTRRVNVIPLDIENADAFEVAFNHLQEMEEWSAMLPFRQDVNTLLSYTHFRNQVQNMSSVAYGSGKTLWDEFKQTAQIAAGTYKPKANAGMMDSRIAAAMGGIAVAKISGRLWTAIKQSQSATVFLPECDFTRFVKNGVNPYGSWKWAMENIPDFRKRVENMTYGDVKLRQYLDELEKWHDWTKTISKIGMAPNILVDGITCAVGARSVYETEVNRLTKLGYPKEKAEEKAYYKAVAAYNKTQQSSGGMYLSPMQVDRTYASAALSLFKNANYAYGRMQIEACRGLARTYDFWGGKHKTALIESMTRQIMEEDRLDENTARAIAKATYNRTFRQSIGRLINFATLVPISWALYKVLPYLLTGDDDDKKTDMIEEGVLKGFATSLSDNYVIPFVSNILNAGLKVEDGKPTFDPEVFRYQNLYINPATSDLANIYSMVGNQKWYSVANKLGMLGVQSLIGFNPETVGALYQALSEADYDNGNTAKEWQIGILKAISAPEESIRELYMDELGLKSGDIKKIPLAELEKRYAERQINRDNLLSQIGMDAETFNGYIDKYQQSFEKKIKDKMDKWDEYDKKKADEFFDTTSDPKLKDMIAKKRAKDANAAADEQIAKEGLNQEKKGKEPYETAYDAVKMSIDVAEDNAISTYNKVLNKRYAALNDEYNNQTDAMKYIFMSNHPNFKAYKDLESEYTTYGKKMKELKEKLVSADGYDAKQTILKQIRAEREKFSELQSKVR